VANASRHADAAAVKVERERVAAEVAATNARIREQNRAVDAAREAVRSNYESGRWERFVATMVGPTPTGQIMRKPDGMTIHVVGDLGKAQGEKFTGYFERDGNYDYTAAGGGASRVQQYAMKGNAQQDQIAECIKCYRLYNAALAAKIEGNEYSMTEIYRLYYKLKGEDAPSVALPSGLR